MHIKLNWIVVLVIFIETLITVNNPDSWTIGVYYLEYLPGMREVLEHVPFAKYFLCIVRINRLQVYDLDVKNAKVNISPGGTRNGRNI